MITLEMFILELYKDIHISISNIHKYNRNSDSELSTQFQILSANELYFAVPTLGSGPTEFPRDSIQQLHH